MAEFIPFNSPVRYFFNELIEAVMQNVSTANRPVSPNIGYVSYNTDEKALQFYGGETQSYYYISHKAAASAENELLVSSAITQSKYGIKRWQGGAGYVKVDGSGVVSSQSTPIPATDGGTGISSYTEGDILYASDSTTLANRNIGSANKVLKSNGALPVWSDYTISDGVNTFTITKGTASFALGANQSVTGFIDDDTFATASSTTFASSESIKAYVDNRTYDNVSYRPPVDVMFDSSSSSLGSTTNTIDGVTVTSGMRVLVRDSSSATQDYKIYSASGSSGSWTWNIEQDGTGADLPTDGDTVWVKDGTEHADERWTFNGTEWVQIAGTGTYTGTLPIEVTGTVISHSTANGYKHIPASGSSDQVVLWASSGTGGWGYINNANIGSSAAISWSKMAALTANRPMITNSSGVATTEEFLAISRGGTGKGSWTQYGVVYAPTTSSLGQLTGSEGHILAWGATAPYFTADVTLGKQGVNSGVLTFGHVSNAYTFQLRTSSSATADQVYQFPVSYPPLNNYILTTSNSGVMSWQSSTFMMDWKVKVDAAATADYIGDSASNGVLRTNGGISYSDGGNYVMLGLDVHGLSTAITTAAVNDELAIADASDSYVTKRITFENLMKGTPGATWGTQITFLGTVSTSGWAGTGPYTITLKNSGATGNGQQNHGMGSDGKFIPMIYEGTDTLVWAGVYHTISSDGTIVIESSRLFQGAVTIVRIGV